MLTKLDRILFGAPCEVYDLGSQGLVYPIFKNGSTSLKQLPHRVLINQQLKSSKHISIFLRDPRERFISGAYTYLQSLDPSLDAATARYFVKNFLFLNRHYMPQVFWLANLVSYTPIDCDFQLRPMSELSDLTDQNVNHTSDSIDDEFKRDILTAVDLDSYLELDQLLYDLVGTTVRWNDFIGTFTSWNAMHYQSIFGTTKRLNNVLPQVRSF